MIETKDLLLPLIVTLWGATTLVLSATTHLNMLRDKIILGHDEGHPIPLEHRQHIMQNDWKPMAYCVILACFGFSIVAGLSPFMLSEDQRTFETWIIVVGVALYSASMGFFWIRGAPADWQAMKAAVEKARNKMLPIGQEINS